MDIKRDKSSKNPISKVHKVLLALALLLVVVIFINFNSATTIPRSQLLISVVSQGDLDTKVKGSGSLRSEHIRVVSAPSNSVVKEIFLKPGVRVNEGDVIAQLENLLLEQEVEAAEWALSQAKSNYRKTVVNNKMSMLDVIDSITKATSQHKVSKMELAATEEIFSEGIVSAIDYKKLQEEVRQHQRNLTFLMNKKEVLAEAHDELLLIASDEVKQKEKEFKSVQGRFKQLTVRANAEGILQSLEIEPGQSLVLGDNIAMIGSIVNLIAIVKVPQNEAANIEVGDSANLSNGRDKFAGVVDRIAPVVTDNSVEVEIHFPQPLPESVRPQQRVDSTIITGTLKDVTYITRPSSGRENTTLSLFKVGLNGDSATLTRFETGVIADNKIVIRGNVKKGDEIIVSDLSKLVEAKDTQITIE